jgi:uncharacterized protein
LNILAFEKLKWLTYTHISKSVATAAINIQKQFNFYKKIRFRYFRYRKDTTGNLDEVQIEHIAKLQKNEAIAKRKEAIKSIEEQNGLTPELDKKYNKVLIYRN